VLRRFADCRRSAVATAAAAPDDGDGDGAVAAAAAAAAAGAGGDDGGDVAVGVVRVAPRGTPTDRRCTATNRLDRRNTGRRLLPPV